MAAHYNIDVAVIGGGPAGLAAALAAKENGASVLILERDHEPGGILQQCIHTGFGLNYFAEELTGPEYAQRFINRVREAEIPILTGSMVTSLKANLSLQALNAEKGMISVQARSVILAMGCRERTRGALQIPGTRPAGIFPAGQAQRLVNLEGYSPGRRILIIGSGDIGMIMARRCKLEGMQVLAVAEILPYPAGLTRNRVQCLDDFRIPLYLSHTIIDIRGRKRVEGATIAEVDIHQQLIPGTEKNFDCDTILFSVGLIPENEISQKAGCILSYNGGPEVNEMLETSIPGIFACGNVLQVHDLVDWVTLEAERAGANAARYAQEEDKPVRSDRPIRVRPGGNIGYIVPERIDFPDPERDIQFSYRVRVPGNKVMSEILTGGRVLFSQLHQFSLPSEMIIINARVDPAELDNDTVLVNVVPSDSDEEHEDMV